MKVLIIKTKWNEEIVDSLARAAAISLKMANIETETMTVPGALEIPLAVKWAWSKSQREQTALDGIVACGCVIKGDTYHFEIVATESARALSQLSLDLRLPIGNCVLTVYKKSDAEERCGESDKNRGIEAAEAVIEMLALKKEKEFV